MWSKLAEVNTEKKLCLVWSKITLVQFKSLQRDTRCKVFCCAMSLWNVFKLFCFSNDTFFLLKAVCSNYDFSLDFLIMLLVCTHVWDVAQMSLTGYGNTTVFEQTTRWAPFVCVYSDTSILNTILFSHKCTIPAHCLFSQVPSTYQV